MTDAALDAVPDAVVTASRRAAKVAGGLVATGAAGLGYAWAEARWFTVRRATVPVLPGDTAETLAARVLAEEHNLLPRVVLEIAARAT